MRIILRDNAIYGYCTENNISRDELSRRMKVATTTAFRVEKGDVDPSAKFIASLIHTTGKSFDELFLVVEGAAA
jgi:DNA-binding XRE family transcriptional regulator